jgi:hypothetical protein
MKLLPRLVIVLVVCLIAIALPSVPAQAVCVPYSIELSSKSGLPGTEVTIYGHDFAEGTLVDIYYDGALVVTGRTDGSGDFTLLFTIPEGCTGPYEVEADVGYTTVHTYFTVKPGLIVSPEKGPVGATVAVEGKGFAKNEQGIELRYYLNDTYETIERRIVANAQGSWDTSFQIPLSTRGEHKLDAEGAESRLYEVKDATFRVTAEISLDKSSGTVSESITMTGSRFAANEKGIKILLAGQAMVTDIKANSKGEWEASFKVPEMPAGIHNITVEGEWTKKEDINEFSFEIKPDIVLSPDEGHVGMNLTVTGHGFAANEDVVIMYDGSQKATARTNDKGNFEVSFPVPVGQYGERPVTVGYAGGNHASAVFIMESDPPDTPNLISPSDRGRAGLVGRVTPTFEWSEVSDDSGVYYRLQIATSANVTATGEFADPILSITGLVGKNYTLEETEALSYGIYYWIVQAVDGAENESGWSTAYSFRVGLLPEWGFIAIIVAIVVVIGALIRALVVRRRYYY